MPMRRVLGSVWIVAVVAPAMTLAASCGDSAGPMRFLAEADASRRDGSPVGPADGGTAVVPPRGPDPDCASYCDAVLANCEGDQAQYASRNECLAMCARLPRGEAGESDGNSVACRQAYAASPARTDSARYCGAAGPFGASTCGDPCPVFCGLTLSACAPDGGAAPYPSYAECQTTCLDLLYVDGGVDGGGQTPTGPASGNTLDCRLFHLRQVITSGVGCADLGADSEACR